LSLAGGGGGRRLRHLPASSLAGGQVFIDLLLGDADAAVTWSEPVVPEAALSNAGADEGLAAIELLGNLLHGKHKNTSTGLAPSLAIG